MNQAEITYRPDIDGLRAVAVTIVVAYHVGLPGFTGGFVGVDVFFVISGYLITQLLLREIASSSTISIPTFYARRIRRLLPALAIVLAFTLIAGFFLLPNFGEKYELAASVRAAVLMNANHYFRNTTGGYFDNPSSLIPMLHLWSLAVEEQFYMVWPVLLFAIAALDNGDRRFRWIRILLSLVILSSLWFSGYLLKSDPKSAFYILPSRAWELAIGALLATIADARLKRLGSRVAGIIGTAGIAAIFAAVYWFDDRSAFPGVAAVLPVGGAALLIMAGTVTPDNCLSRLLAWKPFVVIGLQSYGWYLWHWPILSIARNRRLTETTIAADCMLALLALVLAWLTRKYVESPIRNRGVLQLSTSFVVVGGLAVLGLTWIAARGMSSWIFHHPKPYYVALMERETPATWNVCLITERTWKGQVFLPNCTQSLGGPSEDKPPMVVIWGDSHADGWAPAVREFGAVARAEVREISFGGCPPILGELSKCREWNSSAIEALRKERYNHPARRIGMILTARWPAYLGRYPIPVRDRPPVYPWYYSDAKGSLRENQSALRRGLLRSLTELHKLNIRVLILADAPEFRVAPIRCADLFGESFCRESWYDVNAYRRPAIDILEEVATSQKAAVHFLDPIPFFCPDRYCPGFLQGRPVTWDTNHVSPSAARAFAPLMRSDFQWLLSGE